MTLGKRLRRARPGPGRRGAAARRGAGAGGPWRPRAPGAPGQRGPGAHWVLGGPGKRLDPALVQVCGWALGRDFIFPWTKSCPWWLGAQALPQRTAAFLGPETGPGAGWVPQCCPPIPEAGAPGPGWGAPGAAGELGGWDWVPAELGLWACALWPAEPPSHSRRSPLAPSHLAQATPGCPGPLLQVKSGVHWWGLVPSPPAEHLVHKPVFWMPREGAFQSRDCYFFGRS